MMSQNKLQYLWKTFDNKFDSLNFKRKMLQAKTTDLHLPYIQIEFKLFTQMNYVSLFRVKYNLKFRFSYFFLF